MKNKLLEMGYSLIPLHGIKDGKCTCGRPDCSSPGKHPITKNGVKDASNDPKIVEKWERTHQNCNFGVAAGRSNNLVVVDVDLDRDAGTSLSNLNDNGKVFPPTFTVKTGGGFHMYFMHPSVDISNKVSVMPGIDIRADGGYVVAPGSTHSSGVAYEVVTDVKPTDLPDWAIKLIQMPTPQASAKPVELMQEGDGRNQYLFSQGRKMKAKQFTDSAIDAALRVENTQFKQPLCEQEVSNIIKSCLSMPNISSFADTLKKQVESEDDFLFVSGTEFDKMEFQEQSFIIDNLLARQTLTLFGAPPKAGKTTFLYAMIAALTRGERFLDLDVQQSRVLLIPAEESEPMVRERLRQFGALNDYVTVIIRNPKKPKKLELSQALMNRIVDTVAAKQIDVVAIDTLSRFVKFDDENDNMETQHKIIPLQELRDVCKASVIAIHHTKKALQTDDVIENFRGASAIAAGADSLIALKEFTKKTNDDDFEKESDLDIKDFQRKLLVKSRMSGPVMRVKIQLDPYSNIYSVVGNSKTRLKNKSLDLIYLNLNGKPLTVKEISSKCKIPENTLRRHLNDLIELKQVEKITTDQSINKHGFVRGKVIRKVV